MRRSCDLKVLQIDYVCLKQIHKRVSRILNFPRVASKSGFYSVVMGVGIPFASTNSVSSGKGEGEDCLADMAS